MRRLIRSWRQRRTDLDRITDLTSIVRRQNERLIGGLNERDALRRDLAAALQQVDRLTAERDATNRAFNAEARAGRELDDAVAYAALDAAHTVKGSNPHEWTTTIDAERLVERLADQGWTIVRTEALQGLPTEPAPHRGMP